MPSAFTFVTGQAHWEPLLRARAIENLAWVVAPAQGGRHENGRHTWGHSMVVDAWGQVAACRADEGEGLVVAELDAQRLRAWRAPAAGAGAPRAMSESSGADPAPVRSRVAGLPRWGLWALLVALVAVLLSTLVWLAGRYEISQLQSRLERDAAEAVSDLRSGLTRNVQSLQALQAGRRRPTAGCARRSSCCTSAASCCASNGATSSWACWRSPKPRSAPHRCSPASTAATPART